MTEITLDSLIGLHSLSGVDMTQTKIKTDYDGWQDVDSITFILDKKIYTAIEDPSDGYRSCMKSLLLKKKRKVANTFAPVKVMIIKKPDGMDKNETLMFIDTLNGKIILEVGTDAAYDYYPYFVAKFMPENMAVNAEVKK